MRVSNAIALRMDEFCYQCLAKLIGMHERYLPISANDISLRRVSSRSSPASGIRDTNMLVTFKGH